jgi:N-acetylneuraminic acid mutarotase
MGRGAGATSVVNGRIYYMGGRLGANGANISSVIQYDPTADAWATKANTMPTPRTWLSSSVVGGKIYAIGGAVDLWGAPLSTVEEYDPATDTWTRKADMPTARLCVSTSAVNGKIYAIGGSAGGGQWYQGLTTVEEYDPATDTWTTKADMPTGRTYFSTCAMNGKIYAIGGVKSGDVDNLSSVEEYDPPTDTWTRKADMPTAKSRLATSEVDGRIYAIGGWAGGGVTSTVEEYDLTPPPPDYNGNGIVDFADMCILVAYWHTNDPLCDIGPWPFGDDGIVDIRDLYVFTEYWLADVGLIAHWKLDETEGYIAHGDLGNHDGTLAGEPPWQPAEGAVDGALAFDGTDDLIYVPFVLDPSDGAFSVFMWVKTNSVDKAIVSQRGTHGVNWLAIDGAGRLATELQGSGRGAAPLPPGTVITDNQWHRVGFTWDGEYRKLYVDDVEVSKDTSPQDVTGADGGLHIGADKTPNAGSFFSGLADDIRVYDRAVEP